MKVEGKISNLAKLLSIIITVLLGLILVYFCRHPRYPFDLVIIGVRVQFWQLGLIFFFCFLILAIVFDLVIGYSIKNKR